MDGGLGLAFQPAAAFGPVMDTLYTRLRDAVSSVPGAMVEHNKFCVSVHFRNCEPGGCRACCSLLCCTWSLQSPCPAQSGLWQRPKQQPRCCRPAQLVCLLLQQEWAWPVWDTHAAGWPANTWMALQQALCTCSCRASVITQRFCLCLSKAPKQPCCGCSLRRRQLAATSMTLQHRPKLSSGLPAGAYEVVAACVQRAVDASPTLRITRGRKVLEVRPKVGALAQGTSR